MYKRQALADGQELFCSGTAWTLLSAREIVYRDKVKTFEKEDLRNEILEILRAIQTGQRDDPFNWIREV